MIRSLRKIHRRTFAVLCIALPVAFGIGIAARKPLPLATTLPAGLTVMETSFTRLIWERADVFSKAPVTVRLLRDASGAAAVGVSAPDEFVRPDLLVYWVTGAPISMEALPQDAQLLGAFSSRRLKLPPATSGVEGRLILFSLADQEIVDVSQPFKAVIAD